MPIITKRRPLSAGRGRSAALPAWPLLVVICASAALLLVFLGTRLAFFYDDWYFLLQRPGIESHHGVDVLLAPHNGNLVALLMLIYKGLVAVFGLGSQLPYRLVLAATVVAAGVFVYLLVSERAGRVVGLVAAAIVVFLGPAAEALLFLGAGLDLIGALAVGLAALFVLEHDAPRRNKFACLLLVCSVLISNGGLPFVVGAAVVVALRRRPEQLWIAAVPALLFGLWWIFYGSSAPSSVSGSNLIHLPRYVLDSVSSGLSSATGLSHGGAQLSRGHIVLFIAAVAIVVWILRGGRPARSSLVFVATALSFWILTGASFIPGREAIASRYQIVDATLLILIAAELVRNVDLGRKATVCIVIAGGLIVASNLVSLRDGYRFMRVHAGYAKADLGALELARGIAPPGLQLVDSVARDPYLSGITAGRYFAETRAHGSPAYYSPAQLEAATPDLRQAADSVLASAYAIAPKRTSHSATSAGCTRLLIRAGAVSELELAAGGAVMTNAGPATLVTGVRRFAPSSRAEYDGFLIAGSSSRLAVPRDAIAVPWHLVVRDPGATAAALTVCPA